MNYIDNKKLKISSDDLDILLNFVNSYKKKKEFSLNKIINTLRIISQMNELEKEQSSYNITIALYYIIVGTIEEKYECDEKGNYTDTYIRKSIIANPGYQNLPSRSPGFEDNL